MHMARAQVSLTQVSASSGDVTMDFRVFHCSLCFTPSAGLYRVLLDTLKIAMRHHHDVCCLVHVPHYHLEALSVFTPLHPSFHVGGGPCTTLAALNGDMQLSYLLVLTRYGQTPCLGS